MKKNNKAVQFISLGMTCMLLSACANQAGPDSSSSLDQMIDDAFKSNQPAATAKQQSATDAEVASALLPDINLSAPGAQSIDVEPRFDIKVNRANVRNFFMGLVADSKYNMILHPQVKGRITLDLKNVTVTDVMEVVRDVYGYDFEKTKTAFSVFPNTIRTRIFSMNYLNINRTGGSNMSVSSGQVTESSRPSHRPLPHAQYAGLSTTSDFLPITMYRSSGEHDSTSSSMKSVYPKSALSSPLCIICLFMSLVSICPISL